MIIYQIFFFQMVPMFTGSEGPQDYISNQCRQGGGWGRGLMSGGGSHAVDFHWNCRIMEQILIQTSPLQLNRILTFKQCCM